MKQIIEDRIRKAALRLLSAASANLNGEYQHSRHAVDEAFEILIFGETHYEHEQRTGVDRRYKVGE